MHTFAQGTRIGQKDLTTDEQSTSCSTRYLVDNTYIISVFSFLLLSLMKEHYLTLSNSLLSLCKNNNRTVYLT